MKDMATLPGYYTTAEAGSVLGRDPSQVWRYIKAGLLPAINVGAQWLIEQAPVHEFVPPPRGNPLLRRKSEKTPAPQTPTQ
jgi:excisionase family DNA binding protein